MKKINFKKILVTSLLIWIIINITSIIATMIQLIFIKRRYIHTILFGNEEIALAGQIVEDLSVAVAFSEATIDLSQAVLSQNSITMDLYAHYCSVKVMVPETWTILEKGLVIMGEFNNANDNKEPNSEFPVLIINHHIRFGEVKIEYVPFENITN